jgi:hypothetical protein
MTIERGTYVTAEVGRYGTVTEVSGRVLDVRGDVIELAEGGTVHKEDIIGMGGTL